MMNNQIQISKATESNLAEIVEILKVNNLPYNDVAESDIDFLIAQQDNKIIGCIGLQKINREGLLRSFAVLDEFKNLGIGKNLFDELLAYAKNSGVSTLHLLTTTADQYFKRNGFVNAERKSAPEEMQKTSEFSGICPSSSVYMILNL